VVLGSTQPLIEMSSGIFLRGKGRHARKADNLTAICEPIVYKIWEPRLLTSLWASATSYWDKFTYFYVMRRYQLLLKEDVLPLIERVSNLADG
jgi:hypothetical protein